MKQELFQIKLLPYSYKRIGFWLLVLALPLGVGLLFLLLSLDAIPDHDAFIREWGLSMVYYPFVVALSLLVFSEEKHEDELVANLRFKSFMSGVYILVVAVLFLPLLSNISNLMHGRAASMPDMGGMLAVLNLLLVYIYGSFKYNLHYIRKELEVDEE